MKEKVSLIVAPPLLIGDATPFLTGQGGKPVRDFAWIIPWSSTLDDLRWQLAAVHSELGTAAVITQLEGGDFFA